MTGPGRTNDQPGRCRMERNVLQHGCIRVVRRRSASSPARVPPCPPCPLPTSLAVWLPALRWPSCGTKIRARRHWSRPVASWAARTKQRQQRPAPAPNGPGSRQHSQRSGWLGNPGTALKRIIPEQTGARLAHRPAQGNPDDDAVFTALASSGSRFGVCEPPLRQQPSRSLPNILHGAPEHPFHGSCCAYVEKFALLQAQDSQVGCTQHRGRCHIIGLWNAGGGTVA